MSDANDSIEPAEALERQQRGALLLDVRDQDEWDEGHVAGAMLIPLDELEWRKGEIPTGREVIVMCAAGGRSAKAQEALLADLGLRTTNLSGGLRAWEKAGLPIER